MKIILILLLLIPSLAVANEDEVRVFEDELPIAPQSYDIYNGEEQVAFKHPGGDDFKALALKKKDNKKLVKKKVIKKVVKRKSKNKKIKNRRIANKSKLKKVTKGKRKKKKQ